MGRPRRKDRHLPPCVYPRHGAYWYVKKGQWTRLGVTLAGALREYAALHEAPRSGMAELIWTVYRLKVREGIAASTVAAYKTAAKKLAKGFAEYAPEQVRQRDVAQMKMDIADTPNMANACVSFLRIVFDYALEHQLVDSNPCVGVKGLVVAKRKRCPTDAELQAVHEHAKPQLRVIIKLLVLTGQRINDVLRIKRSDIVEGGIRFVQQKTEKPVTVRNPELRDAIAEADALHGNVRALTLLHNRRGKVLCYRQVFEEWNAACRAAKVKDLHLHDLRAKSITRLKQQGGNARGLARHSSDSMTERYIREHDDPVVEGPSFGQFWTRPK